MSLDVPLEHPALFYRPDVLWRGVRSSLVTHDGRLNSTPPATASARQLVRMNVRPDRSCVALRPLDYGISSDTHLSFGESPLMDMQDRVFYAAARAQLMAARAEWARAKRADAAPSPSVTWLNKAVHSTLAAIDRRYEMDRARGAVQMIYQKESFDESKHPRAPAGRPDGGQFVKSQGDADAKPSDISEKSNQRSDQLQKAQFESLNQLTTTELFAKLRSERILAAGARNPEARTRAKASVELIQEVLFARNFSDDNAPLAVKERIWKAQQRYRELFYKLRSAEDALAKFNEVVFWKSRLRTLAEQRRELIKAEMQRLANVTGARLPTENPIRAWSFEKKFRRAAEIALESGELAPEIAAQLRAAIEPANLARTAAMMATLAVAHSYPVAGLAADALLLGYVGTDAALVAYRLYLEVSSIQSEADLHEAAKVLNQELAAQTAGKLIQLLTWGGGKGTAAFNKRYKIVLDRAKVKRVGNGSMPPIPTPTHLIPLKIQKRKPVSGKNPSQRGSARKTVWAPPKGWNGPSPKKGKWQGNRGDSGWLDNRPTVRRITKEEPIPFIKGKIVFDRWVKTEFRVPGVRGGRANRNKDTQLIYKAIFERQKLGSRGEKFSWNKHRRKVTNWLDNQPDGFGGKGLRPHHAGGDRIQYVPRDLHQVQHTNVDAFSPID